MLDQDTRLRLRESRDLFYAHTEKDDGKRKLTVEKDRGMVNDFVHLDEQGRPTTYYALEVERIEVKRCKLSIVLRTGESIYIGHTNITPNHYCIDWCADVNTIIEKYAKLMRSGQGLLAEDMLSGGRFVSMDSFGRMKVFVFRDGEVSPVDEKDVDWDEITVEMVGRGKSSLMSNVRAMHEAFVKKEQRRMAPIKSRKGRR